MHESKLIGFNSANLAKAIHANAIEEQNRRLIKYAEQRIMLLGETINSWNSINQMDDTGNLLDSLCWGVCYNGKMVQSGFYRNQKATTPSYLHGWSNVEFKDKKKNSLFYDKWINMDAGEPVNGHQLAETFLETAHKKCKPNHWMVVFAVCAPYWGYWEKGFTMTHRFGGKGYGTFHQFAVMSQFYDHVSAQLKPARTRIHVTVPKYASKSLRSRARKNYYQ